MIVRHMKNAAHWSSLHNTINTMTATQAKAKVVVRVLEAKVAVTTVRIEMLPLKKKRSGKSSMQQVRVKTCLHT